MDFNVLISQADQEAQQGNWEKASAYLKKALELQPDDAGVITGLGTCLLQLGQPEKAVPLFRKTTQLAPEISNTYNNLGVACLLAGQPQEAETAFRETIRLEPDHLQALKNLALLLLRQDDRILEGAQTIIKVLNLSPDDIEALTVLADVYEKGEDYESAVLIFEKVLRLDPDHAEAKKALSRLSKLTQASKPSSTPAAPSRPAPQPTPTAADASRIARPEHARKLSALKGLGKKPAEEPAPAPAAAPAQPAKVEVTPSGPALMMVGPRDISSEIRLINPGKAIANQAIPLKASNTLSAEDLQQFTTFIISNPLVEADTLHAAQMAIQAGKYVIIDLDRDFYHLPQEDPAYKSYGPGNPALLDEFTALLKKASLLTVPSLGLAEQYKPYNEKIEVVPYCWNRANPFWEKSPTPRETINIGVVDRYTNPREAALLKNSVKRLLDENKKVVWVIGGDLELYTVFSNVPDDRKLFVPATGVEEYPFIFASFDALVIPLRGNTFDASRPDLPMLEAGVRRLPWIASPIPAFKEWSVGGLFAAEKGDWFPAMQKIVRNAELRQQLGQQGYDKAQTREASLVSRQWIGLLR